MRMCAPVAPTPWCRKGPLSPPGVKRRGRCGDTHEGGFASKGFGVLLDVVERICAQARIQSIPVASMSRVPEQHHHGVLAVNHFSKIAVCRNTWGDGGGAGMGWRGRGSERACVGGREGVGFPQNQL